MMSPGGLHQCGDGGDLEIVQLGSSYQEGFRGQKTKGGTGQR